jgi:transcriptional regulator GlxA family with amidase domain
MKRRNVFAGAGGFVAASVLLTRSATRGDAAGVPSRDLPNLGKPLRPPSTGPVKVAFVVGPETVLIDVAGPWEAINGSMLPFHTYTVAPSLESVDLGGIKARADYTFATAPRPHVIVVPATHALPESLAWIKAAGRHTDITMSICTGAFVLAQTGLLDGLHATTHHDAYDLLAQRYPKVKVVRGPRFVETREISTSGGETSGIDLGLRVVERYFGTAAAAVSAANMEHVRTRRPWT